MLIVFVRMQNNRRKDNLLQLQSLVLTIGGFFTLVVLL